MARVRVSEAEVIAAQLTIEINDKLGRETPDQIVRLANASRRAQKDTGADTERTSH